MSDTAIHAAPKFATRSTLGDRARALAGNLARRINSGEFRDLPENQLYALMGHAAQLLALADEIDTDVEACRAPTRRERVRWWGRLLRRRRFSLEAT